MDQVVTSNLAMDPNLFTGLVNGFVKPSELTPEHMDEILQTNYYGVIRVTTTLLPLIRKAKNGVILNVSSQLGSHNS